jgi:hypothetical protein
MAVLDSEGFNPTVQRFTSLGNDSCQIPWFQEIKLPKRTETKIDMFAHIGT